MVGKTLSLCITNYNRDSMLLESFEQVLDDERVSEIVIADDVSKDSVWANVQKLCTHPKIKLLRNKVNLGCYKNKQYVISQATNEYGIIFDSDNVMTKSYIDKVFEHEWHPDIILAPDFVGSFNYRNFSDKVITKENVSKFVSQDQFDCLINTMNYFVHLPSYLKVWDGSIEPWTADTIYQNYRWLDSGRSIHVVKGLEYNHRINHGVVEEGSHYVKHNRKTGNLFNVIKSKLKSLK